MPLTLEEMNFIPEEDWKYIADRTERSVEQAKEDYRQGLRNHLINPQPPCIRVVDSPQATTTATGGIDKTFDITIVPGVLSLEIAVSVDTGENWHARLTITAKVFGHSVGSSKAELSRTNSYIEIHPGVALAKADLKIGLYGEHLCFGVEGQACYWAFGWHCTPINAPALFCLR